MIWAPSARAGRHLLSELFSTGTKESEAFHPPRILTPAQFERALTASPGCASMGQQLWAWKTALSGSAPDDLRPLFPTIPGRGKDDWAFSVADQLIRLRERLSSDNMTFAEVCEKQPPNEWERWQVLAHLENEYLQNLHKLGLEDPAQLLVNAITRIGDGFSHSRLLVAGVLNLTSRQARILEHLSRQGVCVDLFLPFPENQGPALDEWGRPIPESWKERPILQDLLDGRVRRAADPRQLVEGVLELAELYEEEVDALAVGAPDSEVSAYIVERSRLSTTGFYQPEGKPLLETEWGRLIRLILSIDQNASFAHLLELLRHSLFRSWLLRQNGNPQVVEKALLKLMRERLIHTVSQMRDSALKPLREAAAVRDLLESAQPVLRPTDGRSFPERIWASLQCVGNGIELQKPEQRVLSQIEGLLQDLQSDFDPDAVTEVDFGALLDYQLRTTRFYPERAAEERPVSGWLELPWERAPHLVIVGLPDNKVPGEDGLKGFLTPSLCQHLKIRGTAEEEAFHAARLRLLLESRYQWGRLDILLPDRGLDDNPEMVSRHLFMASEEEVLDRVELLMGEMTSVQKQPPASFGALLDLPDPPPLERVRVTDFSAYLRSPFHFLLERIYGWSPPRELPVEMEPMQFGTLAHEVMERINATEEGAGLVSQQDVQQFLMDTFSTLLREEFGGNLGVPMQIQASGLRERLMAAAEVIARERQAGWRPVRAEWKFSSDEPFFIEGVSVTGVIDLLEFNEESKAYRIIDYKTSDKAVDALKAHLFKPSSRSPDPLIPECEFEEDSKRWRLKDLQLLLYMLATESSLGSRPMVGYFNLAKAVQQIDTSIWLPTDRQAEAARSCAAAIIRHIREGEFPLVKVAGREDPWLGWFGGDFPASLHPDFRNRYMGAIS